MEAKEFWNLIDQYIKVNNMDLNLLNTKLGFGLGYLRKKKKDNGIPSAKRMLVFKNILNDDVLYELITNNDAMPTDNHDIRAVDDFILSLNISSETREKQRLKRKLQRTMK